MSDREDQLDEALAALRERDIDPGSAGGAVALEFLLGSSPVAIPTPAPTPTSSPGPASAADDADPISLLADWAGVDSARLADFFDFSDGKAYLTIPSGRLPRSKADQQRVLTLLVLAADYKGLGAERTPADPIISVLHHYAAFDQNMGGNLNKIGNQITRTGKPKAYVYKITQPGLEHAKQLIRALVTNEEALEA